MTEAPTESAPFDYAAHKLEYHPCNCCGGNNIAPLWTGDRYGLPAQFGRCLGCGLVMVRPRMSGADYQQFYADGTYRRLVSEYSGGRTQGADHTGYAERLAEFGHHNLKPRMGGSLIDIGGGTGELAAWFAERYGFDATVLDPSTGELSGAIRRGLSTVAANVESWQPTQQYDVLTCLRSIDHLHDIAGALRLFREALVPGGLFIVDAVSWPWMAEKYPIRQTLKVDHVYYLSPATMKLYLKKAGFRIVKTGQSERLMVFVCERQGAKH